MSRRQSPGPSDSANDSVVPRGSRSLQTADELLIVDDTPDYAISTWRFVMFLAWRANLTVTGVRRSRRLMDPWASRWPRGIVLTVLTSPRIGMGPPSEEVRSAMASVSRQAPAYLKGIALISGKTGFVDSIIRSVIAARQLIVRNSVCLQIFDSSAQAAPWVARAVGAPAFTDEFVAAAEKARG